MNSNSQDPLSRAPSDGFRCALYGQPAPAEAFAPIGGQRRDYSKEKPVSEETFKYFRGLYAYDQAFLDAKTESVDDSNPSWRKEKVSFRAAYDSGDERVPAYVYLPKNAKPPYQAVLWIPGGYAYLFRSSETNARTEFFNFLVSTGRAVIQPVYKGTFEPRLSGIRYGPNDFRDSKIQFAKDAFRALDYLAARPDMQKDKFALLSVSDSSGPIILALEPDSKPPSLSAAG